MKNFEKSFAFRLIKVLYITAYIFLVFYSYDSSVSYDFLTGSKGPQFGQFLVSFVLGFAMIEVGKTAFLYIFFGPSKPNLNLWKEIRSFYTSLVIGFKRLPDFISLLISAMVILVLVFLVLFFFISMQ